MYSIIAEYESEELPPNALLSMKQVRALVPLSLSQFHRMIREGTFPQPVRLTSKRIAFRKVDIDAYLAAPFEWGSGAF